MSVCIYNERRPHPNTRLFTLLHMILWHLMLQTPFNTQQMWKFQKIHLSSYFVWSFFRCYFFWPCAVAADNDNGWKRSQSSNNYISFLWSGWGITLKQVLNFGCRRLRLLRADCPPASEIFNLATWLLWIKLSGEQWWVIKGRTGGFITMSAVRNRK